MDELMDELMDGQMAGQHLVVLSYFPPRELHIQCSSIDVWHRQLATPVAESHREGTDTSTASTNGATGGEATVEADAQGSGSGPLMTCKVRTHLLYNNNNNNNNINNKLYIKNIQNNNGYVLYSAILHKK